MNGMRTQIEVEPKHSRRQKFSKIVLLLATLPLLAVIIFAVFNAMSEYQLAIESDWYDDMSLPMRVFEKLFYALPFGLVFFLPAVTWRAYYISKWIWGILMLLCGMLICWSVFVFGALYYSVTAPDVY